MVLPLILSLLIEGRGATVHTHGPTGTTTTTVVIQCEGGYLANSTRNTGEVSSTFTFSDLPKLDTCLLLVGAFDKQGELIKMGEETFFTTG